MKKNVFIILLLFSFGMSAQDLDIYNLKKNSNFNLPDIPKDMTYDEFEILSTNLRIQDMAIAIVLPGHVHFKINEKKQGYYILGARGLGYAGWAYLSTTESSLLGTIASDATGISNGKPDTGDQIVAYTSLTLIVGSYLYDWIHGKYMLDRKQNKIRYKYAMKKARLGVSSINLDGKIYPSLSFNYKF